MTSLIQERRVAIPFRVPLGGQSIRRATLLQGPAGWGESSPLPGYACELSKARAAAEEAACEPWPAAVRREVTVNALVPAVPADEAAAAAAKAAGEGFSTIKVKVGAREDGGDGDLARLSAVRDAVGPHLDLRIDANGAWDVEFAIEMIRRLAAFDLRLVEQPVVTIPELAEVRRRVSVPVAADESVRDVDDARRLAQLDAADVLVVKVQPLGGVAEAMRVIAAAGVPAIVSSLYETSVGLATGLALAAALPELPYACGLATAGVLAGDVVSDPLVAVDGVIRVRHPIPDPALLDRYEDRS